MSNKIRITFLVIGFAFFCYLVSDLGIKNISTNIARTGFWFIPIILIWGMVYFLNALSWAIIMGKESGIGFGEILRTTISSFAINYITPFMSLGGEPYRVMAVKDKLGLERSVSSVFLYRLLHSVAHLIFLLIAIIIVALFIPAAFYLRPYMIIISVGLIFLIGLLLSSQRNDVFSGFLNLARKIPVIRAIIKAMGAHDSAARDIDSNIKELYQRRKISFYLAIFIELVSRFLGSLEFFFILHALDINIPLQDAFYLSAASSLFLTILFFVPFELGTREGSFYLLMGSLHLNPAIGIYIGLVNRIRELFWILVGLGLVYVSGRRLKPQVPVITVGEEDIAVMEKKA